MNIHDFKRKKIQQEKICMLTCYDYPSACIIAESNIDCVLVGDSVAMAVHGHSNTIMATIDMMALHTAAVARGLGSQFLISDLPFLGHRGSYDTLVEQVKILLQAGAHAIKIEGADAQTCERIYDLVVSGIPVMGHIGLTPQSIHQLGGYRVQGKQPEQAQDLIQQAMRLEAAGCFAVVIECVPSDVAKVITDSIHIPTIGIGAGSYPDGQVLVWHDLLGLQTQFKPKFVKQFAQSQAAFLQAINEYAAEVKQHRFPSLEYAY